ncbi:MAG: ferredoxin:protochlorophyllide reductase (ATP-dependent) subunit N, partial [Actinomycetota bacterium]|nr:ferredoxin:protochlorophyllide reductase (ATP-dependent) subunit N [Actinomycetota bacterium]
SVPADARGGLPGGVPELPAVGEGTVVAVLDPYLVRAAREAEECGAQVVKTLFPVGVDGTSRFVGDVVSATGGVTSEVARARQVWEGMEHLRGRLRGKRVFLTGDSGMEIPLARFLANAGAVVLEVGTPRLEKRFLGVELSALGSEVDVVEAPDWRAQLGRIEAARPDVVVAGPGLFVPLVARGHLCRSSLDVLALDPRGYEGARRVLALFSQTLERAEALDALNL